MKQYISRDGSECIIRDSKGNLWLTRRQKSKHDCKRRKRKSRSVIHLPIRRIMEKGDWFSLPSFPTVTENKSNETPILITVYNFKSSEDLLFAQEHIPSNLVVKLAVNYPDLFLIAFKPSNLIDSKHIEYLTLICNKCLKIEVPTSRIFETDYPTLINSISDNK